MVGEIDKCLKERHFEDMRSRHIKLEYISIVS